jgi:hypothetical protein
VYTVYKVTNNKNGKFYIGVHKTDDLNDSYMGSGKAIKAAIKKYGREYFSKTIIFVTDNEKQAYELEKALTSCFIESNNYNMKLGGVGGFAKEVALKGFKTKCRKGGLAAKELGFSFGGEHSNAITNGKKGGLKNKGVPKSEAHKQALREAWKAKKTLEA